MQALKLDIEFKDDKIGSVGAVATILDEADNVGCSTEVPDIRSIRKQKLDLDYRVRDQVISFISHSTTLALLLIFIT